MTPDPTNPPQARRRGVPWRPVILLAAVLAVMLLAYYFEAGAKIKAMRGWIDALGPWGPGVFVLIYAGATVAALPGVALTAVAGGLFGSVVGTVAVSLGSTLGAGLAFLAARYFARASVESWLAGNPRFQRLDRMVERQGAVVVAITRLVPLFPFNLLNFGFGLTKVPLWTYLLYSWLCMLPGTILYVVGFDALFTGIKEGRVPWALVAVVAAMAVLLFLVVSRARRRLRDDPDAPKAGAEQKERP
jgi:uncharacterized membrane protein YdjX (TVP38/TMEM64 family)